VFEIGPSLREARLRQGIDLRDAETATKIRTKYLRALEDERFDQLPAETYIRGFLRTYAEHLGLDGQLYVDEYSSRYTVDEEHGAPPMRARRTATGRTPRRRRNRDGGMVIAALAAIALVTALVIAAWRFGGGEGEDAGIPGLDAAGTRTTTTAPAPPPPAAGRTLVVLRAVANSFVEVHATSQTGRQLYSGTLERGQSKRFQARRVWLNIGIPQNVRVTVNGKRVQLLERRKPTIYLATPTGLTPASPTT
jgi:cytoskeleton protein RodZ